MEGELRIKPADYDTSVSDKRATEPVTPCQINAVMLQFVNENQNPGMQKVNPVPKNVMTLIDGELAKHATVAKEPSWLEFTNDASGLTSGLFCLLSTIVVVVLLY